MDPNKNTDKIGSTLVITSLMCLFAGFADYENKTDTNIDSKRKN